MAIAKVTGAGSMTFKPLGSTSITAKPRSTMPLVRNRKIPSDPANPLVDPIAAMEKSKISARDSTAASLGCSCGVASTNIPCAVAYFSALGSPGASLPVSVGAGNDTARKPASAKAFASASLCQTPLAPASHWLPPMM